jgi:methyl-accepting chemotaxis protein
MVGCLSLIVIMYRIYGRGIVLPITATGAGCICNTAIVSFILAKEGMTLTRAGIALVTGIPIIAGLVIFMVRQVVRPTRLMTKIAQQTAENDLAHLKSVIVAVASGDLTQSLTLQTTHITYTSNSEIGDLARSCRQMISDLQEIGVVYNGMTANLRHMARQVVDSTNNVGVASEQLTATADQSARATHQVAAAIQQVAAGAAQQTENVTCKTRFRLVSGGYAVQKHVVPGPHFLAEPS